MESAQMFFIKTCPTAQARALAVSFFAPRWQHSLLQSVWGLRGPMAPCPQLLCPLSHERFGAPTFQNMAMEGVYTHFGKMQDSGPCPKPFNIRNSDQSQRSIASRPLKSVFVPTASTLSPPPSWSRGEASQAYWEAGKRKGALTRVSSFLFTATLPQ